MSSNTGTKKYVKLSHVEHILKLPDTYIGSITNNDEDIYIYEDDELGEIIEI
jgi:DNA gyrase/topoisomerase IV subunit B